MSAEARRNLAVPMAVRVRLPDSEERREWAVNLSAGGLCLQARERLPVDTTLLVSFELESIRVSDAPSRVVWESADSDTHRFHETGLHFEALPPETAAAIEAWASQPTRRRR